jgi:hypothetical protein
MGLLPVFPDLIGSAFCPIQGQVERHRNCMIVHAGSLPVIVRRMGVARWDIRWGLLPSELGFCRLFVHDRVGHFARGFGYTPARPCGILGCA